MINIKGINKAELLMRLYNNAKLDAINKTKPENIFMDIKEARCHLKKKSYFDCLHGKLLYVDLFDNFVFDETDYDECNGKGKAQQAVDECIIAKLEKHYLDPDYKL